MDFSFSFVEKRTKLDYIMWPLFRDLFYFCLTWNNCNKYLYRSITTRLLLKRPLSFWIHIHFIEQLHSISQQQQNIDEIFAKLSNRNQRGSTVSSSWRATSLIELKPMGPGVKPFNACIIASRFSLCVSHTYGPGRTDGETWASDSKERASPLFYRCCSSRLCTVLR